MRFHIYDQVLNDESKPAADAWLRRICILCLFIYGFLTDTHEPGRSVSIMSDYRLDGRGSSPDRAGGFFL
jgi:hypothetical protein